MNSERRELVCKAFADVSRSQDIPVTLDGSGYYKYEASFLWYYPFDAHFCYKIKIAYLPLAQISRVWVDHGTKPVRIFWLQHGLNLTSRDTTDEEGTAHLCWLASAPLEEPEDLEEPKDSEESEQPVKIEERLATMVHIFKFDHPVVRLLRLKATEDDLSNWSYTVFLVSDYIVLTSPDASGLLVVNRDTLTFRSYLQYTAEVQPRAGAQALAVCAFGAVVPSATHNCLLWLHNETLFEKAEQQAFSYQVTPLDGMSCAQIRSTAMDPCGWFTAMDHQKHLLLWRLWPLALSSTDLRRQLTPSLQPEHHYIWETPGASQILRLFVTQGFICSLHRAAHDHTSLLLWYTNFEAPEPSSTAIRTLRLTDTTLGTYYKSLFPSQNHYFQHVLNDPIIVRYDFKPSGNCKVFTLQLREQGVFLTTMNGRASRELDFHSLQRNKPFLEPLLLDFMSPTSTSRFVLPHNTLSMSLCEAEAVVRAWAYHRGHLRGDLETDGPFSHIRRAVAAALTSVFPVAKRPRL